MSKEYSGFCHVINKPCPDVASLHKAKEAEHERHWALRKSIPDKIKDAISARDKEWVDWIDELFRIRFSNGEIETKPYIAITFGEWQEHKKSIINAQP